MNEIRLPPSFDSSLGVYALGSPRASHGVGSPRTRKDDGMAQAAGTEGDIHRRSDMVAKKGRPHPSSDSSPGPFPLESPRASHGVGSPRTRKNDEMDQAAGIVGDIHRRSDIVAKKGRPHPSSDSSPGPFPLESPRASDMVSAASARGRTK